MPDEAWKEVGQMALCGLAVAAVAAPVGLVAWRQARRRGESLLPRPHGWRVPWGGLEVFFGFVVVTMLVPMLVSQILVQSGLLRAVYGPDLPSPGTKASADDPAMQERVAEATTVLVMWTSAVSFPFQVAVLRLFGSISYPAWRKPARRPGLAGSLALASAAWALLTLGVLTLHFGVTALFRYFDWQVEDHPLAHITTRQPLLDQILFVVQACVAAPAIEEFTFRGLLLPWLLGRRYRTWPVLVFGCLIVAGMTWKLETGPGRGPMLFAAGLLAGWGVLRTLIGRKRRTIGAIYASAALFAVVHSHVWPSPIPLFVLGLGLGWLAVRTRGVLVPIIVHGLFNAVSVLFVLSGG